ncbi:hypothetical protein B0A58_09000 [Flavobacterium branchiophilum NBRC 15030 = ATCC 35035]|uniref:Lipoprotein n=1 Tax=Flavobacterium branchiophilum TaxID=55197 RepID=A0A543G5Q4_9FLAO|nr:hypothetical protein [Flavobacterium branchiophilum]OXA75309.1 hypothetical protein B0A58_09000 [Flavobacterium branchiophilum NBRC 15030 = ATCC 35035]TQM41413.1 hypothetical protein BC670_2374 [Flavobacterium branchiophilum]GEM55898.1 hypothetical protein FB1_21190 [Flavobacterium branchiophilum NBRC 15030 = ATCC 35035]
MKKITLLVAFIIAYVMLGCTKTEVVSNTTDNDTISEVFELKNVNFAYNNVDGYNIYRTLNPNIYASDVVLIYRLSGTINSNTPIWQLIPRTLYLTQGELDYDFDFSKQDFTIYAGGNYNLALTPSYLNNQTFRIVIVPGYFSNKVAVDYSDYHAVIKAFNINDTNVKSLN